MLTATLNSSYSLDGTIKAFFFSGSSSHIKVGDEIKVVKKSGDELLLKVDRIKDVKNASSYTTLIHFEGYNTPEKAKELSSSKIYIPRSMAPKLEKGKIYTADLIGMNIVYKNHTVGECKSIIEGSQSLLLEVERFDGKKYLLPYMNVFIGTVSADDNTIELKNASLLELEQ